MPLFCSCCADKCGCWSVKQKNYLYLVPIAHTHTCLTAFCPGLPGWAGSRKVKPIWILLKQETVSGSGIRWAICKSAPRSRQITMPAPHRSVFYRPDALPADQPTVSKHWRLLVPVAIEFMYWQPFSIYVTSYNGVFKCKLPQWNQFVEKCIFIEKCLCLYTVWNAYL